MQPLFPADSRLARAITAALVLFVASTAAAQPDLVVQEVAVAASAAMTRNVRVSLPNLGSAPAWSSRGRLIASRDASVDASDVLLAAFDVPPLAPGATASVLLNAAIPEAVLYLIGIADADDTEAETNTSNNTRAASVSAGDPYNPSGTLSVCPTCPYRLLSEAGAAVQAGQTILVESTTSVMVDCLVVARSDVTIRGVLEPKGRRPSIGNTSCGGKGIVGAKDLALRNLTIEGLELSGATVADGNGAGIRFQGLGLTLRNVFLHDNENGLLSGGATGTSTIRIEHSIFLRNGSASRPGKQHNAYVSNTVGATLEFLGNISLSAAHEGHELKSRTERSSVSCNVLASLSGVDSYTIDFPQGGDVSVSDNVLQQGPESSNKAMLSFARESDVHATRILRLARNTIVNDHPAGYIFALSADASLVLDKDVVIGPGPLVGAGSAPVSDTSVPYPNRSAFREATGSVLADWSPLTPTLPELPAGCARLYPRRFGSLSDYARSLLGISPRPSARVAIR